MFKKFIISRVVRFQGVLLILFSIAALTACSNGNQAPPNLNMVVSLSTDGSYAIATNTNKEAVLWDLKGHSYKIVFKDANVYSAYFIKNTDDFMYQNDATNEVVIEDVNGNILKTFNPGFPTYGEVMTSDLNNWFASDVNFVIYKMNMQKKSKEKMFEFFCASDYSGQQTPANAVVGCASVRGDGKLFNLTLTPNDNKLVGAAFGGAVIWNTQNGQILGIIKGNDAQTVAAISLDGSYMVTGDITSHGYFYNLVNSNGFNFGWDTTASNDLTAPYFKSLDQNSINEILTVKYIDQDKAIVIFNGTPDLFNFAVLFSTNPQNMQYSDHWAQKVTSAIEYFPLISNAVTDTDYQKNWPLTQDQFSRDQAIDTSPSAHILVMSMAEKNGIIVYKYDPATQTLTREWAGEVKPWWEFW